MNEEEKKLYTHREVTIIKLKNRLWQINGFLQSLECRKEKLWKQIKELELDQ